VPVFVPGQVFICTLYEQQADQPQCRNEHHVGSETSYFEAGGQLAARDHDSENCHHGHALEEQGQRRGSKGERLHAHAALAKDVENDEDHGLQRDSAEDITDSNIQIAGDRSRDGDRHLRKVRRHGQHDQPAKRAPQMQAGVEHIRRPGKLNAGDPDNCGCSHEKDDKQPQRNRVHWYSQPLPEGLDAAVGTSSPLRPDARWTHIGTPNIRSSGSGCRRFRLSL
jgi:hypothetical protein